MTLQEALKLADEAEEQMFLNKYPVACVILRNEIRRLKQRKKRSVVAGSSLGTTQELFGKR